MEKINELRLSILQKTRELSVLQKELKVLESEELTNYPEELDANSVKVSTLKQGGYAMIQGRPCRIVAITTSRD
jgi:hypothetical protein